jgi:maltooligosyltrehalose trehalohydrolase
MKTLLRSFCGASVSAGKTEFRVWAPNARQVTLRLHGRGDFRMQRDSDYFSCSFPAPPGDRYSYLVNGSDLAVPDPVSRLLPEGVHGPTEIVDPEFPWSDEGWRGLELRDYLIYEMHTGTFTREGTFDAAIEKLDYLKRLGITVIEIMPVGAFPGTRNWGYDGVSLYAVQASYGGPQGLKRLVNAAHERGLAVILDVVYNHLGNEGNYLRLFGPYFTDRHKTPWGDPINYDAPGCEAVRRYFVENALYWISEYHMDGLRLDAIQTIEDDSPKHIVAEIRERVHQLAEQLGRRACVIAETDENDADYVRPASQGGFGLDAVWSDDFHHAVHTLLTGEKEGYYQDFGRKQQLVRALNEGYAFQGEYFAFWNAKRGTSAEGVPLPANVICIQNHDQVGNRAQGERLTVLAPRAARKLAAALLLLAPHTPLLFMGQEYDEPAPFQFFTDYGDPKLQEAVRKGRREEFKDFTWEEVPDPQDVQTFERSKLNWQLATDDNEMLRWYRELIALRRKYVVPNLRTCQAEMQDGAIMMRVPKAHPMLTVIAEWPECERCVAAPNGWNELLTAAGDGYGIRIFARPGAATG